jgi:hypothetical protein
MRCSRRAGPRRSSASSRPRWPTHRCGRGDGATAITWQLLQSFGAVYVGHIVKTANRTNDVFALVLGLLAFLYLTSVTLVLGAEVNAVRVDRLYPRALLTPFTDNVSLTSADRKATLTRQKVSAPRDSSTSPLRFTSRRQMMSRLNRLLAPGAFGSCAELRAARLRPDPGCQPGLGALLISADVLLNECGQPVFGGGNAPARCLWFCS